MGGEKRGERARDSVTMVERRRRVAGGGWRIDDRNGRGALKLLLSCFFLAPWETNGLGEGGQGARASSGFLSWSVGT